MEPRDERAFRLGDWWVTPDDGRIVGPRGQHHVAPRMMDLLVFLTENVGRVVAKEEILEAIWHDTIVEDAVVFRHVSALRQLLGDDAKAPRFIETIPKRGYRLIAPFEVGAGQRLMVPGQEPPSASFGASRGARLWIATATATAIAAVALAVAVGWALASRSVETPGVAAANLPTDPHAYELYLASLAASRDPATNRRAIDTLSTVVELEPSFAPAWESLAERFYLHGAYGGGGRTALEKAFAAARRSIEIDPQSAVGLGLQVALLTERGEVADAYDLSRTLLAFEPDHLESHLALSYVYRYAGLLEEAAQECEIVLAIDPDSYRVRSCASVFYRLGDFARAKDTLRFDAGSEWSLHQQGLLDLHRKQPLAAIGSWRKLSQRPWTDVPWAGLMERCLAAPDPSKPFSLRRSADAFRVQQDPESLYIGALVMSVCDRPDLALGLLADAAERGYCAPSAFDSEPAFAALSEVVGFDSARRAAIRCRDAFLAHREKGVRAPPRLR